MPLYYDARGDKLNVAVGDLNERIAAKLRVNQWCDKEATRDAVRVVIRNFL